MIETKEWINEIKHTKTQTKIITQVYSREITLYVYSSLDQQRAKTCVSHTELSPFYNTNQAAAAIYHDQQRTKTHLYSEGCMV
jgi:hypothetical protein